MLIKEYRIPLPLTVDEYRIAQLYMIAKKSREESSGSGSGVEILVNEPYENGPGGNGQYTRKIYHVGSHLPGWIKSLLPKSALIVEEEAWNAYPYTKTRYTCPFMEKFLLEIETVYHPDSGQQENVFNLTVNDLRNRTVDLIDIVNDRNMYTDNDPVEDVCIYVSEKTGRGPLDDRWLSRSWDPKAAVDPDVNMSRMCAYKLCRVEFRYWGMQTKLEKFIHDTALRKTMYHAHRQAWVWQDEWYGMTMDDIRELERQTQIALKKKMGDCSTDNEEVDVSTSEAEQVSKHSKQMSSIEKTDETPMFPKKLPPPLVNEQPASAESSDAEDSHHELEDNSLQADPSDQLSKSKLGSKGALHSPMGSTHNFDLQVANWRMEKLEVDSISGSEEEFFDCLDLGEAATLVKWSSMEFIRDEDDSPSLASPPNNDDPFEDMNPPPKPDFICHGEKYTEKSKPSDGHCPTSVLVLVFHAGSVLDANIAGIDQTSKHSDLTTFRGAFESVMRQHYPSLVGHLVMKLVCCPAVCTTAIRVLSKLSPYSFDASPSSVGFPVLTDIPIGAIPLISACTVEFQDDVNTTIENANRVYETFLSSTEGDGFKGQIVVIGDSMGAVLVHDALCRSSSVRHGSEASGLDSDDIVHENAQEASKLLTAPSPQRRSSSTSSSRRPKFEFEVGDFFMFGSPLSVILAARKLYDTSRPYVTPNCTQVYNLFHGTDPVASRIEPLLSGCFYMMPPINIPRYTKYPLGNGQPYHLLETIQSNPQMFNHPEYRRSSDTSMQSTTSSHIEGVTIETIRALQRRWWGPKRIDYALYCPEGLSNFPSHALPHLFHASYWESTDVIAFVLRQLSRFDTNVLRGTGSKDVTSFCPGQPLEKWQKKRTSVKLKNVAANHRANDVICNENQPQKLAARFMYGPLDMICLTDEKVDIYVMKEPPSGEWCHMATVKTEKTGRVNYTIPDNKSLGHGIFPVKMVVCGDHTSVDFYLAVIPPKTECVVFSIDGSFTASMSVSGRDPKVRAGAVDICRHWQELGFLLIYITGRPDMQLQKVMSWLSKHNFPQGMVSFADGVTANPLHHKTAYLNDLIASHDVLIHAAYGSNKDINVYTNIGMKPHQIYIVGKVSKKLQPFATPLVEGYAAHLHCLTAHGGSRPAQGNQRMVIPKGCFNIPGQSASIRRRRWLSPAINKIFLVNDK
ncbi:Protein retinal degeneration B, partial [Pseudolycoriella hygida]